MRKKFKELPAEDYYDPIMSSYSHDIQQEREVAERERKNLLQTAASNPLKAFSQLSSSGYDKDAVDGIFQSPEVRASIDSQLDLALSNDDKIRKRDGVSYKFQGLKNALIERGILSNVNDWKDRYLTPLGKRPIAVRLTDQRYLRDVFQAGNDVTHEFYGREAIFRENFRSPSPLYWYNAAFGTDWNVTAIKDKQNLISSFKKLREQGLRGENLARAFQEQVLHVLDDPDLKRKLLIDTPIDYLQEHKYHYVAVGSLVKKCSEWNSQHGEAQTPEDIHAALNNLPEYSDYFIRRYFPEIEYDFFFGSESKPDIDGCLAAVEGRLKGVAPREVMKDTFIRFMKDLIVVFRYDKSEGRDDERYAQEAWEFFREGKIKEYLGRDLPREVCEAYRWQMSHRERHSSAMFYSTAMGAIYDFLGEAFMRTLEGVPKSEWFDRIKYELAKKCLTEINEIYKMNEQYLLNEREVIDAFLHDPSVILKPGGFRMVIHALGNMYGKILFEDDSPAALLQREADTMYDKGTYSYKTYNIALLLEHTSGPHKTNFNAWVEIKKEQNESLSDFLKKKLLGIVVIEPYRDIQEQVVKRMLEFTKDDPSLRVPVYDPYGRKIYPQ
jgi:hypothetical protein